MQSLTFACNLSFTTDTWPMLAVSVASFSPPDNAHNLKMTAKSLQWQPRIGARLHLRTCTNTQKTKKRSQLDSPLSVTQACKMHVHTLMLSLSPSTSTSLSCHLSISVSHMLELLHGCPGTVPLLAASGGHCGPSAPDSPTHSSHVTASHSMARSDIVCRLMIADLIPTHVFV